MNKWNQYNSVQTLKAGQFGTGFKPFEIYNNNNVGLGTFKHGDGEMVMLNNTMYCIRNNNETHIVDKNSNTIIPFASCANFQATQTYHWKNLNLSWADFLAKIKTLLSGNNNVFTMKAHFRKVSTRSLNKALPPYPPFSEWELKQTVTTFNNVAMDCVGFISLHTTDERLSTQAHFHCINPDRNIGGHILDATILDCTIQIMPVQDVNFFVSDTD